MKSNSYDNAFPLTSDFLKSVARLPGVYLMKAGDGVVLYVGKARDLRNRLSSYARYDRSTVTKTAMLLSRIRTVETLITQTEKEALILEASLIKKHLPRYNVILRDDKNYPYLKVTVGEKWPRLVMSRRRVGDGSRYFGPFSSSGAMWETLNYLHSIFPLRRCKGKEAPARKRPCLNFQMHRCLAPCVGNADPQRYQEMVKNVLMVLEGKKEKLVKQLTQRMDEAAKEQRYEDAALCRDWLRAIGKTLEKQVVVATHKMDQDVFGMVREGGSLALAVLLIRQGRLEGHHLFFVAEPLDDDGEILREAMERFYEHDRVVPHEVVVPLLPTADVVLAEWLTDLRGSGVKIVVPRRGDRVRLLQMAEANARQAFADKKKKSQSWQVLAGALKKTLQLRRLPDRIECLDISNIGGELAVGSLVCFQNGDKEKAGYRHYKIRTVQGADDYAMMREVLLRRLQKGRDEGGLPDLLLVDGGKGQLNIARQVLKELDMVEMVELAGIAKERDEEGEKLYRPGRKNPVLLARHSPVLLYLMRIRDEAHRYGITFHRKWRRRHTLRSVLDE
ncbi:MAG: excinuclease ABC subunit UvrC, partial [Desulfobulbaceae bacterium]|nr:excinuclease ABC subunit UvrC [Desulfobulbaceae bacterium]